MGLRSKSGLNVSGLYKPTVGIYAPANTFAHWPLKPRSTSTVEDIENGFDGTANTTNISGTYITDAAEDNEGTDTIDLTTVGTWGSNLTNDHAVLFTVDGFTNSNRKSFFDQSEGDQEFSCFTSFTNSGDLAYNLSDDTNDNIRMVTDNGGLVDDGNKHRVAINKSSNSGSDPFTYYVDGSEEPASTDRDQGFDTTGDFTNSLLWFGDAGGDGLVDCIADNIILCDGQITSAEATDDYNAQPWS